MAFRHRRFSVSICSSTCFSPRTPFWMQESSTPLSENEAVDLIKDTFASAAERDIYTVFKLPHSSSANLHFVIKIR